MKKQVITSLFFIVSGFGAFAQEVDVKKDRIIVDGTSGAKIEKDGCSALKSKSSG